MCTVSYIPLSDEQFVLTSNRDERIARPTSSPLAEVIGNTTVYFPKDQEAGGTWIAAGDNGRICCLLNGAFESHQRKVAYGRSRGKVLLETFEYERINDFFTNSELIDVEPFTLIVLESDISPKLVEFRWDAQERYIKELDRQSPYIWSSATLYSKKIRMHREQRFNDWLKNKAHMEREEVLNFHSSTQGDDPENDFVMERDYGLQTVSITQVESCQESFSMYYFDLLKNQNNSVTKFIKKKSYA